MKVLLINGSPHEKGCTYTALSLIAGELKAQGIETEILHVGGQPVGGCIGCGGCRSGNGCVFGGVVNEAIEKAKTADAFVFGSPVHYASDTKGTMAIQIYVPFLLKEAGLLPKGDIITAAVISEEIAGYGAMVHTQENRMLTDYAIVGEATENDIAIGSRGRCCGVITITGKSCHASIPHVGHNPFDFLAQLLPELQKVPMGSDGLFGSSTMSCTRITSSEEGTNIIPNEIVLYVDYRQSGDDTPEEVQRKLEAAIANCHVDGVTAKAELLYFPLTTYTGVEGRGYQGENPFVASADADYIQKVKAAIEDAVGREIQTKPWAFATDTGHYAAKGVKCLGYSPAEIKLCHTTRDSIDIAMMEEGTVGYLAAVQTLANEPK